MVLEPKVLSGKLARNWKETAGSVTMVRQLGSLGGARATPLAQGTVPLSQLALCGSRVGTHAFLGAHLGRPRGIVLATSYV